METTQPKTQKAQAPLLFPLLYPLPPSPTPRHFVQVLGWAGLGWGGADPHLDKIPSLRLIDQGHPRGTHRTLRPQPLLGSEGGAARKISWGTVVLDLGNPIASSGKLGKPDAQSHPEQLDQNLREGTRAVAF